MEIRAVVLSLKTQKKSVEIYITAKGNIRFSQPVSSRNTTVKTKTVSRHKSNEGGPSTGLGP